MFKLSRRSESRLSTCHDDLQLIIKTAISISDIDFGVSEGHRSIKLQKKYYDEGKSQIDGINKKGKHNYNPSLAVDIYLWINGKASWDEMSLMYVAGIIKGVSEMLIKEGKISHRIRWGGTFGSKEFKGWDKPHFELINIK